MNAPPGTPSKGNLRWLSQDYAVLREEARQGKRWDVLIVGSGYGGATAAMELAGLAKDDGYGERLRLCVLERGKEYARGMFPSSLQELPGHGRVRRDKGKIMGRPAFRRSAWNAACSGTWGRFGAGGRWSRELHAREAARSRSACSPHRRFPAIRVRDAAAR